MALGRYAAICHPLHARGFINMRGTRVAVVCVFVGSLAFALPRFWHYHPHATACHVMLELPAPDVVFGGGVGVGDACGCFYHSKEIGTLFHPRRNGAFLFGYGLASSLVGIFVPLIVLTACNVCLIRALRQSYKMQALYRANQPKRGGGGGRRGGGQSGDSGHRITPTLIALIVLFTVLVTPSHMLVFARLANGGLPRNYPAFNTAAVVTNFLLLTNFAVNFVLYCVINVQFRRTARELVVCAWVTASRMHGGGAGGGVGGVGGTSIGDDDGGGGHGLHGRLFNHRHYRHDVDHSMASAAAGNATSSCSGVTGYHVANVTHHCNTDVCNISETEIAL